MDEYEMTPELQALVDATEGMDVDAIAAELSAAERPPADPRAMAAFLIGLRG